MRIELPAAVETIISTLSDAGFEAYAVGGCVRDSVLGRVPDDWDITTSAKPEQVKALFRRTVDTGIQHGTVTVLINHVGYEVTTYRIDGSYEDGRHPTTVTFTTGLREDLQRRDFTVNAMAYNLETGIVDIFGGMKDLEAEVIRCVGSPAERFAEDALRMLRAIRFAAQLGFTIDEDTKKAIKLLAPTIKKVSEERIQVELTKMLCSPHPECLEQAYQLGITSIIMPEFDRMMQTGQHNPHHCYSVGEHTLKALQVVAPDKNLRYATLFHDVCKPEKRTTDQGGRDHFYGHAEAGYEKSRQLMRRFKMDLDTIQTVSKLVLYHDYRIEAGIVNMRRAVAKIGEDIMPLLFNLQEADIMAQSMYERDTKLERLRKNRADYATIVEENQCTSLKDLAVKGADLIAAGVQPGKAMGDILQKMLADVIEHPEHNNKEYLLKNMTDYEQS